MACRPFDPFKLDARVCVRNGQVCLIAQGRVTGPGRDAHDAPAEAPVIPLWILRTLQKALRDPLLAQIYLVGKSIRQVAREEGRDPATICRRHQKKLREIEEEILRGPPKEDDDGPAPIPAWLPLPRPGGGSRLAAAR